MKKIYIVLALALNAFTGSAQNPGLVISEVLANPSGSDNSFEWVELIATKAIDFSLTPYSVVVTTTDPGTVNGWVEGGAFTYGFNITTGTVAAGNVVYVGGSAMLPTGTKLRVIDVQTTAGDGLGNAAGTGGVIGNGGNNMDGVAVFSSAITNLTSSSVPVDAIFFGTAVGTALVNGGADGFQLPVNDRYTGGKLQSNSFFAGDPGGNASVRATGSYNTATNSWTGPRLWEVQTAVNNNTSAISLVTTVPPPTPGTASIAAVSQGVSEAAGTVTVNVTFANANSSPAKVAFGLSSYTNATQGADFSWTTDTLTIPASSNGTFPFTIQLTDDLLSERTERIIVKLVGSVNATIAAANFQIIYLTDNDYQSPVANNELQMSLLTSFSNGPEGPNSAEIVAYDSTTQRLYIVNSLGAKLDIVNFSNPSSPVLLSSNSISSYGNINSLTVYNGIVAAAIENTVPENNGSVVFFNANGVYINQVTVGAMPDMITYNHTHTKILVACEGQPKDNYTIDPVGCVAIVDLTPGIAALTNANVAIAGFTAWNGQEASLRAQGIRINGPGSSAAQDFEPEYITLSDDNQTAYVSLQENNAMAVVNINTATVTAIRPLGLSDYSTGNGMDASDQTAGVYISSVPVKGMFMPDALAHSTIGGTEYIFSANEGDAREYAALTDVAKISATSLDPVAFPDQNILKSNQFLGRLNAIQANGDTDNDGDIDEIRVFGTRSFSIWNAATGALVFDSKDLLEQITANHPTLSGLFNASNSNGTSAAKNRSDDKGPEPEGVSTAFINGNHYLFVSLERVGGVMIFNVDNPAAPVYSGYYNNRTVGANSGPDRGAEGIIYIRKEASPNGRDLVILANEVSSTLSIFQLNTCVQLAGATISAAEDSICAGSGTILSIPGHANSSVQWFRDGNALSGATGNTLSVNQAGDYRVFVSNTTFTCADTTVSTRIVVKPVPSVSAGTDRTVCQGESVTLAGDGALTYSWNNPVINNTAFVPAATATYTVTGTAANGCQDTDDVLVTVNNNPPVSAGADQVICEGESVMLSGSGAQDYSWNNVTNGVLFSPEATANYTVTGTDANGCVNTDEVLVIVNNTPTITAGTDREICAGESVTLTASGGQTYSWNNSVTNGTAFSPNATATYTVTGTSVNGCEGTDQVSVVVNPLPVVNLGADTITCANYPVVILNAGTGFSAYHWNNNTTTQTTTATIPGTYVATVTDANGCQQSDDILVTIEACLGVEELAVELSIFPNPANEKVIVRSSQDGEMQISVMTISGQEVLNMEASGTEAPVDLTHLATGSYIVKVTQHATTRIFRIQKAN